MPYQCTCPICGNTFAITHPNHRFCSFRCKGKAEQQQTIRETEIEFGAPLAELLRRWYIEHGMSVRQIIRLTRRNNRTILRWLDECSIPKRKGSSAIAGQWANNEARRTAQSKKMIDLWRSGKITTEHNPMRRPELRQKLSDMRKGAGNPMYNRLGPDNPKWKGGKVTEYGPGWRSIRTMVRRRDGNKCVRCGSTKNLQVHHIIPYRESHDNSLGNLITLCGNCHPRVEHGSATLQLPLLNGLHSGGGKTHSTAPARGMRGRHPRRPAD